jgi:hypothetical protein
MASRTKTDYTQELTKYFRDFDRLKARLKRAPTKKELGPLPRPGREDMEDATGYRAPAGDWRGARVPQGPTTYKVRH